MSEHDPDPLPSDLLELLEREKAAYGDDAELRRTVLAGVEMAIGLGGPGGGGPDGGGGPSGGSGDPGPTGPGLDGVGGAGITVGAKSLAAIVLGSFIAGGAVTGAVVTREAAPTRPVASVTAPTVVLVPPSAMPSAVESIVDPIPSTAASVPSIAYSTPEAPRAVSTDGDLTRERELLDVARAALARGNADEAILGVNKHAQRWPRGHLVEDREVVWVQALVLAGRRSEAEAKAIAFRKRFPDSILLPTLDAALRVGEEKDAAP